MKWPLGLAPIEANDLAFEDIRVTAEGDRPERVLWLAKKFRHSKGKQSKGMTYPMSFCLSPEHAEWCRENLANGFKVVRVYWVGGGRMCYRYGIRFGSDRDMVIYRMFHD